MGTQIARPTVLLARADLASSLGAILAPSGALRRSWAESRLAPLTGVKLLGADLNQDHGPAAGEPTRDGPEIRRWPRPLDHDLRRNRT